MGEGQGWLFEPTFNRSIKLREADPRLSDNAGTLLLREVDHRLGLTARLVGQLHDDRDPRYVRYSQLELLRQHVYGLAMGYVHQDDQDALAHDAAMKLAVWDRPGRQVIDERLASQPSDWRLIEQLSCKANQQPLREALAWWVGRHQRASGGGRKVQRGTIDIDPFPIPVHGRQPGGAYHGYYRQRMYQPIVASFSGGGDYDASRLGEGFVHAMLRAGDCGGASGMVRFTREAIRKCRDLACGLDVRIDAGLVEGRVLDAIDDEGVRFLGRIRGNAKLDELARPYLKRPVGRPNSEGDEFAVELGRYQAASWTRPYRLVLVVVDLPDAKTGLRRLFPNYFFLITNAPASRLGSWDLVAHYRQRGTFEDRLGELNACVHGGLSQGSFAANETSLLLKLLAFNLASMLRGEMEASLSNGWDLKRLQQTVLKAGVRITEHSRRLIVDVAEAASELWRRLLKRVQRWWRNASWRCEPPRPRPWRPPPLHAHRCLVLRE